MQYEDLTRRIIGCAMEVHKRLGNGFPEVMYQKALSIEMRLAGLEFKREIAKQIYHWWRSQTTSLPALPDEFVVTWVKLPEH